MVCIFVIILNTDNLWLLLTLDLLRCKRPPAATTCRRIPDNRGEEEVRRVSPDETGQYGIVGYGTDLLFESAASEVHRSCANAQLYRVAAWSAFQACRPDKPYPHPAAACDGPWDNRWAWSALDKRAWCSALWCHQWACVGLRQFLHRVQVSQGLLLLLQFFC